MTKWNYVEDSLPQFTDLYNVSCQIATPFGGYQDVKSIEYEIKNTEEGNKGQWILPEDTWSLTIIYAWAELPEIAPLKEKEDDKE